MPQKTATLHQLTFTMSNHNYLPLSRRDTQLKNHYKLYMNSLKDHYTSFQWTGDRQGFQIQYLTGDT